MTKPSWTPWHQVVRLRDDLRTGELALNEFAADLYDVALKSGRRPHAAISGENQCILKDLFP